MGVEGALLHGGHEAPPTPRLDAKRLVARGRGHDAADSAVREERVNLRRIRRGPETHLRSDEYPEPSVVGAPHSAFRDVLMNWRCAVPRVLSTLALTACGGTDEVVPSRTGIYQYEVVRNSDTCTPKRAIGGFGQVSVRVEADGHVIPFSVVGEGDAVLGMNAVKVAKGTPFESESGVVGCPGAREWNSLELLSDLEPIEVRYEARFTNPTHCRPDPERSHVTFPENDCEASLLLRYRLVQVCEAPCAMQYDLESQVYRCECD